jgi:hypothetical protein
MRYKPLLSIASIMVLLTVCLLATTVPLSVARAEGSTIDPPWESTPPPPVPGGSVVTSISTDQLLSVLETTMLVL